jgi:hypothetical protein
MMILIVSVGFSDPVQYSSVADTIGDTSSNHAVSNIFTITMLQCQPVSMCQLKRTHIKSLRPKILFQPYLLRMQNLAQLVRAT